MLSPDTTFLIPADAKNVDASAADVDFTLKVVFTDQGYARRLRNGSATAAGMQVLTLGGNTVNYFNIPSGGYIDGLFAKLKFHANTTATNVVAEK